MGNDVARKGNRLITITEQSLLADEDNTYICISRILDATSD
jgi:hypothetical protein